MRLISLLGLFCLCSISLVSQQKPSKVEQVGDVKLLAEQMSTDADIITLKGNVQVFMGGVAVYADAAEFNRSTMDLTPRGHVRIKASTLNGAKERTNNRTDVPLIMPK
jgi:lipopolysaccharide assembly outer membrane protein LptD (OstA)